MIRPRPHLATLAPVHHGSISDAELVVLGLRRDQVIDFSTSTNPLGPSPAAILAAREAVWTHYPDDGSARLKEEIARREGVEPRQVVVGNGSAELIWLVALAFLGPGDRATVVGPTFGEYSRASAIVGASVDIELAVAVEDFAPPLHRLGVPRVLWLCDPNNPTGRLIGSMRLHDLAGSLPEALLVVDEAYAPFVDNWPPWPRLPANVVRLRSLTKDGAMPGLRLGYAITSAEIARSLDAVRPPWSVNAVAQAAGVAALSDDEHMARARDEVRLARSYVAAELARLGRRVHPSAANFVLVEVGDAAATRAALLRHGVVVRDCSSFGLPAHVRIGLRPKYECERLVAAFEAIV